MMAKEIEDIRAELEKSISVKPEGFYSSYEYTKTGNTRTHPYTIGVLTKILWAIPLFKGFSIEVEPRLVLLAPTGKSNIKFNPDVVVYDENDIFL